MKVFELRTDGRHETLTYADEADSERIFHWFDGAPIGERWTKTSLKVLHDPRQERRPEGDFPCFIGASAAVFSTRAVNTLFDLLHGHVEYLPVECDMVGSYQLVNFVQLMDAFDEAKAEVVRFSDGRIMRAEKYAFYPEKIAGLAVFKIPQFRWGRVYVTETFVDKVREAGLKGFRFEFLWEG